MLGHGDWSDTTRYERQTLKDNLRLFTTELLDRIHQEVVRAGHAVLKKPDVGLEVRCDSCLVETHVEFPTDTGLLFDAVRKALGLVAERSVAQGLPGWRQPRHHLRPCKKAQRRIRSLRHATTQDEQQRQARQTAIEAAHRDYLAQATTLLERIQATRTQWLEPRVIPLGRAALDDYVQHAERQIDQIRRRVLKGEVIPHAEKVFSIFEPHTEWISKGKAGVPVELGLRVCVVEDQYRFILHHQVMEKTTDDQVAVPLTTAAKTRFSAVQSISFDKGFHSPANQTELPALVGQVVLPKKGKLSEAVWKFPAQAKRSSMMWVMAMYKSSFSSVRVRRS